MNRKLTSILIAIILVAGGAGAYAYSMNQNDEKQNDSAMKAEDAGDAMMKEDDSMKKDDSMTKDESAMGGHESSESSSGKYITLADYNSSSSENSDTRVVYFFHASWCPNCKAIDESLVNDPSQIPDGVTIIKTDFDNSTDLRQKYGVTTQYTFVEVDKDGNEVKQWTAPTTEKALAEL